jgi:hypothetical protein
MVLEMQINQMQINQNIQLNPKPKTPKPQNPNPKLIIPAMSYIYMPTLFALEDNMGTIHSLIFALESHYVEIMGVSCLIES